jgi:hypothetical protein
VEKLHATCVAILLHHNRVVTSNAGPTSRPTPQFVSPIAIFTVKNAPRLRLGKKSVRKKKKQPLPYTVNGGAALRRLLKAGGCQQQSAEDRDLTATLHLGGGVDRPNGTVNSDFFDDRIWCFFSCGSGCTEQSGRGLEAPIHQEIGKPEWFLPWLTYNPRQVYVKVNEH